jgi:hypothetical protein
MAAFNERIASPNKTQQRGATSNEPSNAGSPATKPSNAGPALQGSKEKLEKEKKFTKNNQGVLLIINNTINKIT